jgi:hypothetical protein
MVSSQYIPARGPARLLTMAEIEAANLAAANLETALAAAALLALQADLPDLPPPAPLVRCTGNVGRVNAFEFDMDTDTDTDTEMDTDMSEEEYKSWFLREFGYPMPTLPADRFLPPQL